MQLCYVGSDDQQQQWCPPTKKKDNNDGVSFLSPAIANLYCSVLRETRIYHFGKKNSFITAKVFSAIAKMSYDELVK